MKNSKIIYRIPLLVFALGAVLLTNCTKEEKYSCDEKIDEFVKDNIIKAKEFNKDNLTSYGVATQRAFFSSYDLIKKESLWYEKQIELSSLIGDTLEEEYINSLFKLGISLQKDKVRLSEMMENGELEELLNRGKRRFNWTNTFILNTFFRLEKVIDKEGKINTKSQIMKKTGGDTCNCSWNLSCNMGGQGDCDSSCGSQSDGGCGFLWGGDCDASCTIMDDQQQ